MNIIQIGTNRGNDDITLIVKNYASILNNFIAVEPLNVHHSAIRECYKDIPQLIIEEACIVPLDKEEEIGFYYHKKDAPNFEISSTNPEHILKHASFIPGFTKDDIVELKVKCLTLNNLFKKYNLFDINILHMDVEGLDFELIKSINFDKYKIYNIVYERLHINEEESVSFLKSKGYRIVNNFGHNGWSIAGIKL
jgi:FkbM family methyltransferase